LQENGGKAEGINAIVPCEKPYMGRASRGPRLILRAYQFNRCAYRGWGQECDQSKRGIELEVCTGDGKNEAYTNVHKTFWWTCRKGKQLIGTASGVVRMRGVDGSGLASTLNRSRSRSRSESFACTHSVIPACFRGRIWGRVTVISTPLHLK